MARYDGLSVDEVARRFIEETVNIECAVHETLASIAVSVKLSRSLPSDRLTEIQKRIDDALSRLRAYRQSHDWPDYRPLLLGVYFVSTLIGVAATYYIYHDTSLPIYVIGCLSFCIGDKLLSPLINRRRSPGRCEQWQKWEDSLEHAAEMIRRLTTLLDSSAQNKAEILRLCHDYRQ